MHRFFDPTEFGELTVDPFRMWWRGDLVALRPCERDVVLRLLQSLGQAVTWQALALALDFTEFTPTVYGNVRCYVSRVRSRFYAVDPGFTQLEAVKGVGFLWSAQSKRPAEDCPITGTRGPF